MWSARSCRRLRRICRRLPTPRKPRRRARPTTRRRRSRSSRRWKSARGPSPCVVLCRKLPRRRFRLGFPVERNASWRSTPKRVSSACPSANRRLRRGSAMHLWSRPRQEARAARLATAAMLGLRGRQRPRPTQLLWRMPTSAPSGSRTAGLSATSASGPLKASALPCDVRGALCGMAPWARWRMNHGRPAHAPSWRPWRLGCRARTKRRRRRRRRLQPPGATRMRTTKTTRTTRATASLKLSRTLTLMWPLPSAPTLALSCPRSSPRP
mmetsp:Transcript_106058/g.304967  ORF Transcript_106058/g.304967 Transcript_106058/m.304967 type:complete len:268 (+) Transcript_106058:421-1224(+)